MANRGSLRKSKQPQRALNILLTLGTKGFFFNILPAANEMTIRKNINHFSQFIFGRPQIRVVLEPGAEGGLLNFGLAGIDLPRVYVEGVRAASFKDKTDASLE